MTRCAWSSCSCIAHLCCLRQSDLDSEPEPPKKTRRLRKTGEAAKKAEVPKKSDAAKKAVEPKKTKLAVHHLSLLDLLVMDGRSFEPLGLQSTKQSNKPMVQRKGEPVKQLRVSEQFQIPVICPLVFCLLNRSMTGQAVTS